MGVSSASSDFELFSLLKELLRGQRFQSLDDVKSDAERVLNSLNSYIVLEGITCHITRIVSSNWRCAIFKSSFCLVIISNRFYDRSDFLDIA